MKPAEAETQARLGRWQPGPVLQTTPAESKAEPCERRTLNEVGSGGSQGSRVRQIEPLVLRESGSWSHSSLSSVLTEVPAWPTGHCLCAPQHTAHYPRCLHLPTKHFLLKRNGLRDTRLKRSLCSGRMLSTRINLLM